MTKIKEDDILLGQLAMARGMVGFADLLACVHSIGREKRALHDLLIARGHLSNEQVTALQRDVLSCDECVRAEIASGQTLVLDHIKQTTNHDLPKSYAPVAIEATLFTPPETPSPSTHQREPSRSSMLPDVDSRYELKSLLGKGGMGEVWLARDQLLMRDVAIKTLHINETERREQLTAHLTLEAQVTGVLEHPSIIPVYDIGELRDRGLYYTMRVVREENLEGVITRIRNGDIHADSLSHLVGIVRTALLALHYAHDHGVIHRDLKPENILVGAYGEVFIIDWGVAKVSDSMGTRSLESLSISTQTRPGALVGTPHYMSPEQALGENDRVDARTDVYAMGVILYEILTLEHLFDASHVLGLLFKITEEEPVPPSERAPERHIPAALEAICLKALAKDPDHRYQDAQQMARDIEQFLEGVKEFERHQELALSMVERARTIEKSYHTNLERWFALRDDLLLKQAEIPGWASLEEKEPMWRVEQDVDRARQEVERCFGEAVRAYGQALGYDPRMAKARRGLAELYWQRFVRSEQSGDEANAIYFEGLVRQYNDGHYDTLLEGLATIHIYTNTDQALCRIYRYEKGLHRLQTILHDSCSLPTSDYQLPHGSYLLTIEAEGKRSVRVPLLLERLEEQTLRIELIDEDALPQDMVVITGGDFLSGSIQEYDRAKNRAHQPTFAIKRAPVTCAEYVDFLNGLVDEQKLDEALNRGPKIREGAESYFKYDVTEQRFYIPAEDKEGDAWDPNWPIVLVTYEDAEAYAAWLSRTSGLPFAIPTAPQMEKAARGVDGRVYAWGNDFDPSFCRMRESEKGRPLPAPVGSYHFDRSPYGVTDLTGNVTEWTSTWHSAKQEAKIIRGGCYSSSALGCRFDWPLSSPTSFRYSSYGFRVALALSRDV